MKSITFTLILIATLQFSVSQNVATFENFSLPPDSFYYESSGIDFQTTNAIFEYDWNTSFGGYWSSGFAYTNKNDSINGGFSNLYNCIAYKGYNNSNYYVTGQANGIIKLKTATDNTVDGFYITNTTYAYKSMKNGDSFAKKFGGASGNDPDFFKITVKGFHAGVMKTDSSEFYLADFRNSNNSLDYIVRSWQWVSCSNLGVVDSIQIMMYSSDNGSFGMNTPGFFSLDNFTTSQGVGINELSFIQDVKLFPNPSSENVFLNFKSSVSKNIDVLIYNSIGQLISSESHVVITGANKIEVQSSNYLSGIYFIELKGAHSTQNFKFIKN